MAFEGEQLNQMMRIEARRWSKEAKLWKRESKHAMVACVRMREELNAVKHELERERAGALVPVSVLAGLCAWTELLANEGRFRTVLSKEEAACLMSLLAKVHASQSASVAMSRAAAELRAGWPAGKAADEAERQPVGMNGAEKNAFNELVKVVERHEQILKAVGPCSNVGSPENPVVFREIVVQQPTEANLEMAAELERMKVDAKMRREQAEKLQADYADLQRGCNFLGSETKRLMEHVDLLVNGLLVNLAGGPDSISTTEAMLAIENNDSLCGTLRKAANGTVVRRAKGQRPWRWETY